MSNSTTNSFDQDSVRQIWGTLACSVVVGVVCVLVFEVIWRTTSFYRRPHTAHHPHLRTLGWLRDTASFQSHYLPRHIGLDACMTLRLIRLCYKKCLFTAFFGLVVLTSTYVTAGGDETHVDRLTLGNVSHDSRMWAAIVFAYIFAIHFLFLIKEECRAMLQYRVNFFVKGDPSMPIQTRYTVLVENIPEQYRSNKALKEFFSTLFPENVHSATVLFDVRDLETAVASRDAIASGLRDALEAFNKTGKRPQIKWGWCCSKPVDAILHLELLLQKANAEVAQKQQAILRAMEQQEDSDRRELRRLKSVLTNNPRLNKSQTKQTASTATHSAPTKTHFGATTTHPAGTKDPMRSVVTTTITADAAATTSTNPVEAPTSAPSTTETTSPTQDTLTAAQPDLEQPASLRSRFLERMKRHESTSGLISLRRSVDAPLLADADYDPNHRVTSLTRIRAGGPANSAGDFGALDALFLPLGAVAGWTREAIGNAAVFTSATVDVTTAFTGAMELLTLGSHSGRSSTGFVTFKTQVSATMACGMLLSRLQSKFLATRAPEPRDIVWANAFRTRKEVLLRGYLLWFALLWGFVAWVPLVVGVVSLASYGVLEDHVGFLRRWHSGVLRVASGVISIVLLLSVMRLLAFMLWVANRYYVGRKTRSGISRAVFAQLHAFFMITVFVTISTSTVWDTLKSFQTPLTALKHIGLSLPAAAGYLCQLVVVKSFVELAVELLRPTEVVRVALNFIFHRQDPIKRVTSAREPPYELIIAGTFVVLAVACAYEVIAPVVVLPPSVLFFGWSYVVYKHQALFVWTPKFECGGALWDNILPRLLGVQVFGQVLLFAYLLARGKVRHAVAVVPLPLIVWVFHYRVLRRFLAPLRSISLDHARSIDAASCAPLGDTNAGPEQAQTTHQDVLLSQFSASAYQQPVLLAAPPTIDMPGSQDQP